MTLKDETLALMEGALSRFESALPPPELVSIGRSRAFRYAEAGVYQALVQKLARVISGLHAAALLVQHGFLQEQGALHRIIDDINEDIAFLAAAVQSQTRAPIVERYLKAFNEEQAPAVIDPLVPVKGPDSPPRQKIRSYTMQVLGKGIEPSQAEARLAKAYSGYVHAASQNVMEMYGGVGPRFHVRGMVGTPMQASHQADYWNYLLRGLQSCIMVAKAFGDENALALLMAQMAKLDEAMAPLIPW